MHLRVICVACISPLSLLIAVYHSVLWMYGLFIRSPDEGHLSYLQFGAITDASIMLL